MAQGVRRLLFNPVGASSIPSRGGHFVPSTVCPPGSIHWVVNLLGGQFVRWFIQVGRNVWWTIRKWKKQPYTVFRLFMGSSAFFRAIFNFGLADFLSANLTLPEKCRCMILIGVKKINLACKISFNRPFSHRSF